MVQTNEHDAMLLHLLHAQRHSWEEWRIYADWLEDHGEVEMVAAIRRATSEPGWQCFVWGHPSPLSFLSDVEQKLHIFCRGKRWMSVAVEPISMAATPAANCRGPNPPEED